MFFWMLATYYIVQLMVGPGADKSEATRYSRRTWLLWLAVGVSMGFATLSKYHVLFLFAGVFMFVVTNILFFCFYDCFSIRIFNIVIAINIIIK